MQFPRAFASDNNSGAHPEVLAAISRANPGHQLAYGADPVTRSAVAKIRSLFRGSPEVFFVFNGTGANVLALNTLTRSFGAILCASTAHIQVDECGAPERLTGCKLLSVRSPDGKLTPALCDPLFRGAGDQHHAQPQVVAISQPTELGTVYTPVEIAALAAWSHERGLCLYVDGARLANAAASLGCPLSVMLEESGVDAFSFGGTKNGLLFGEALVFLRPELARDFVYLRKQGLQLASKMRYLACQFEALLEDGLWLRNAEQANRMAKLLEAGMRELPGVRITQRVEANGVFAEVPAELIPRLQEQGYFYVWDAERSEVRWLCSWDTTEEDVRRFVEHARRCLAGPRPPVT